MTRGLGAAVLALSGVGCGILGPSAEAPDACGFPRGTPLVFAGRSTTATLQVQEVVGDPMSNDLADIYITRDEVAEGAIRGQLVCAIYVDTPGFVELTVAPEGWDLETGRPPLEAIEEPQPPEVPEPPAAGVPRGQAIAAAREAVPEAAEWEVGYVAAGPAEEIVFDPSQGWAAAIPPDRWVWRVDFVSGDSAWMVFLDYEDGTVHGTVGATLN